MPTSYPMRSWLPTRFPVCVTMPLAALVGKDAPGLSASTIARLKEVWTKEHARWQKRDMSAKRYVYCWADGIHAGAVHPGHHWRDT
jgi:hypothetical protein